ncbi:DUF6274 family protein [Streptomyces sp. NPDC006529]|uniref:DUF6274 family protein n=1 Tax=Streptomyces sp. NPDC006529 TaxID=3157177 RepID=UPI0033BF83CD
MNARDELRALLKAHLSASRGRRHLRRHCLVCNRLLRLAREAGRRDQGPPAG